MKKVFQWMSALALMVMCTCAFVACSDDDDDNNGGNWTPTKSAKILGTWEISSVSSDDPDFDPYRPGPEMGQTVSFKSDGTFTQGGESGTFKYNNETGEFSITSKHMSSKGTAQVSNDGETMVATIDVTSDGVTVTYTVQFEKIASGGDEGGDWTAAKDTKILGSWEITDIETEAPDGPDIGDVLTFKSDGSFVQGRDKGTFKYNNETGAFSAKMGEMSMKGTFTVSEDGESMSGVCNVTQGKQTFAYRMSFVKYTGGDEGGDGDDTDWSEGILDTRMIGTWTITVDEDVPSSKGQTATFNANGTCTIGGHSYTYSTKTDTNKGEDRIKFTLYLDGEAVNEGRLVLVCGGGVLNGEYWTPGQKQDRNMALVMKKPNFTYPSGGVKGRWKITTVYMNDGPSVGEVIVFNSEGEMYTEGDAHVNHYTYSGNNSGGTLNIELDKDGDIPGTLTISNGIATFEVGGQPAIVLQKQ